MESPPPEIKPLKKWTGVLASVLLPGAGFFLSGARRMGLYWLLGLTFIPSLALLSFGFSFMPAWLIFAITVGQYSGWLFMLWKSYRPTPPVRWFTWPLLIIIRCVILVAAVGLDVGLMRTYQVPTAGMAPTIRSGDYLLVERWVYWCGGIARGDIVAFSTNGLPIVGKTNEVFLKRVAGLPGDAVTIKDGRIYVNDTLFTPKGTNITYEAAGMRMDVVVPAGEVFLLGDNTQKSMDSRYFGPVPLRNVFGKCCIIYWPWSRVRRTD